MVAQYGRSDLNSVVKEENLKNWGALALWMGQNVSIMILLQLRMTVELQITGAIRRGKFQSYLQHQQTNTQLFADRVPSLSPNQQR